MLSGVAIRSGSVDRGALAALLAALASLLVAAGHVEAQCQYDVTVLQFPINCGIGTVNTTGLSLNENGAVVGSYRCPISDFDRPFLWTAEEGFTDLGLPPGVMGAIPTDINDQGVICGTMYVTGVGFRGFVYDQGVWTELPPVVDAVGAWSSAAAISNAGVVVGQRSITENLNPQNAYIWSADEGFTDLGEVNGPNSAATAISETGVVAGWTGTLVSQEAFLWEAGNVTLLGPIPGGLTSTASAVADEAPVSGPLLFGWGHLPMDGFPFGVARAFAWNAGQFTMLGTLKEHVHSAAFDAKRDPLQIVGDSWNVDGNTNISHGFIWQNATLHNVNDLVPPELELLILSAGSIDNTGQILANGHDADGHVVAFLLTPIQPVGDLDADCRVGILDLLTLLTAWGPCPPTAPCSGDLDNDGAVNIFDLILLLINWG